jgi:hypothetical protein
MLKSGDNPLTDEAVLSVNRNGTPVVRRGRKGTGPLGQPVYRVDRAGPT